MKKIWMILLMMSIFLTGCQLTSPTEESTQEAYVTALENEYLSSSYIQWYGRHTYVNERMYFYHTATGFKIDFYGRAIEIELFLENKVNDIYYTISKNGEDLIDGEVIVQSNPIQSFIIEFDTFEHHTLEIVKRSEPEDGITSLNRISTNGYFNEVNIINQIHFLLIGASGISGHGALGSQGQQRTTANSSSLHSFGYLTASAFQGSFEFVSSSGWGLAYGYNDLTGETNIAKAYDYIGIHPSRQIVDIPHNHLNQIPDFIIINIGGNDFTSVINKLSGFERSEKVLEFKEAVAAFIFKLRENAPYAHILWTMTSGSMNGNAANEVINMLDPEDKAFVHMVIIKQVGEGGDPIGANNHASYITHQKSAQNLIDHINQIMQSNGS
jgi:hypothetical protein